VDQDTGVQPARTAWKALDIAGGLAAVIAVLVFRRNFAAELWLFKGFGLFSVPDSAPSSAGDWFTLLQENGFVGLALFGLFDLINFALLGLIFLALYGALRNVARRATLLATIIAFAGIAISFATNNAFAMHSLSSRFAAATSDAERAVLLVTGETLLRNHNPGHLYQGTGIYVGLLLVLLAGLLISIVMLRDTRFGRAAGYTGILANLLALGYFITLVYLPAIVWLPPTLAAPFRILWYILIAIRLFQLGKERSEQSV
jgi:hypothetical protein